MGSNLQLCHSEQLLVFLAISWKITRAQLAFYLLPVVGAISLPEVDIGSVPGRRWGSSSQ